MVDRVQFDDTQIAPTEDRVAQEAAMAAKGAGVQIASRDKRTGEAYSQEAAVSEPAPEVTPEPAPADRPEWLPEKFKSVEDMAKAYSELEKKLGAPKDEPAPAEAPAEGAQDNAVAAAQAEFAEKGELSDGTFEALAKAGLDRSTVEAYIAGQQAQIATLRSAAFEVTGGEEGFNKMAAWGRDNLQPGEIAAIDALLGAADPAVIAEGAKQLAAKFNAEADVDPTTVIHGQGAAPSAGHFRSRAELVAAMSDKRYSSDPAYREEVAGKIARASRAGVQLYGG